MCDATAFPKREHDKYDEVYASNILEHFSRFEVKAVLAEWVSLLKPGGLIKIVCPDVREIARQLSLGVIGIEWFNYLIFGGNDYEYNVHKYGFDMELLREMLINLDCVIEKEIPSREWENRRLDKYCPMVTLSARRAK